MAPQPRDYKAEWQQRKFNLKAQYPATPVVDMETYEEWTDQDLVKVAEIEVIPPALWVFSDTHVGAKTFDHAKFKQHKQIAIDAGAVALFAGDAIECVTTGSQVAEMGAMFEQYLPEDTHPLNWQTEAFLKYCEGIKIEAMVEGNHEARLSRKGYNPIWEMCRRTDSAYLGVLGVVLCGKASYLMSHGEGGGQRHHQLRMRDFPGHDVYLGGHDHMLSVTMANEGQSHIRTGNYLGRASYSLRQQYSGIAAPTGSVLLHLNDDGTVASEQILR